MAGNFTNESLDTLLSYHAPSFSVTKEPTFGVGSSQKKGLIDMLNVMDFVKAFIAQNEWVDESRARRFANIYKRYKEQYEKANKKNILSDYCSRRGHLKAQALWSDLKALKDELEDKATNRLVDVLERRQRRRAHDQRARLATSSPTMSTLSENPDNTEEENSPLSHEQSLTDGHLTPGVWEFIPVGPECDRLPEPGDIVPMNDEELTAVIDRLCCKNRIE
ncbi:hypothetical protein FRB94_006534 [Tulasnella sp. JGI-2019a]|nr:hypothetical protein FRB93_004869 [Tulasnella sp. JGI-2019a]KAG8998917.1 hypothetical protein FRB94_006534 [Tulasnella sp. JGI-2019a]